MKSNDMLSKIKEVLNLTEEVKLEQMKLENGTILEAESFEAGKEVFIITDDEKVALPVGEYELEDGKILIVEEVGMIKEIKSQEEEEKEEQEEPKEEEMAEYKDEEKLQYVTREEFKKEMDDLRKYIKDQMGDKDKEEMSADDLGNLITEELSSQEVPEEVQTELNKPAAEPIKANPEADSKKISGYTWGQNRQKTTADRVMEKIFNINN